MIWGELPGGFTTGEDSVQPVSISSIDICDEASCESSWVDAIGPAVEEFLPSGFTWLLES